MKDLQTLWAGFKALVMRVLMITGFHEYHEVVGAQKDGVAPRYERRDVNVRALVSLGVLLFLFIIGVGVASSLVVSGFSHLYSRMMPARPPMMPEKMIPPEPRLQTNETADMPEFHQEQEATLESYGWIDSSQGIVHIPVDRAMDLIAERGLPTRSSKEGNR